MEEVDVRGQNSVDSEWMAYIGAFRFLRSLNVADCHRVTNSALWAITGIYPGLTLFWVLLSFVNGGI